MGWRPYWALRTKLQSHIFKIFSSLLSFLSFCVSLFHLCAVRLFFIYQLSFLLDDIYISFFLHGLFRFKKINSNFTHITGFGVFISRSGICLVSSCLILFSCKTPLRYFLRIQVLLLKREIISSPCLAISLLSALDT